MPDRPNVSRFSDEWVLTTLPAAARPSPSMGPRRILKHDSIGDRYRSLTLEAPMIARSALPGQFVMLTAARDGESTPALPRPMAIYSADSGRGLVEIMYGVVGGGTRRLSSFEAGEDIYVVGPLGRPFDVAPAGPHRSSGVLLLGRGIGTCSLTTVAEYTAAEGIETVAVTSARNAESLIGVESYLRSGVKRVHGVIDADGSSDPTSLFETLTEELDRRPPRQIFTCGSERLTRLSEQLAHRWGARVQVSVEAHMACGLGYCHGCASGARSEGDESPLICHDGPVFDWAPPAPNQLT